MNEVTKIHLGRAAFTVSVDAQKELRAYLDDIKAQVGKNSADVLEEVELRMAELLQERGITGDKVVVGKDVTFLKEQLGEPSDFSDSDTEETHHPADDTARRLFRDTEGAMVAGVASGLARYLGIDPVIVRLLFIAVTFFGGAGILIYILLWLLVPEAKTTSDRLSMQGKAATVENLKQMVEKADVPGATRRAQSTAARVVNTLGRIILFVIGLPLAIGAGFALLTTLALGTYFLMDGFKVAGHIVAPIGSHEVVGFVAGVITLLTTLLTMMLVGIAMVRRRWQLPAWGVAALLGVFFLSAAVGGALAADVEPGIRHRVEALQHTQTVQLASFNAVTLNGSQTDFSYVPDGKNYVRYHYFGSINADKLHATVTNGKLVVDTEGADPNICDNFCVGVDPGLDVEVHGPRLSNVMINGRQSKLYQLCLEQRVFNGDIDSACPTPPDPVALPNGSW